MSSEVKREPAPGQGGSQRPRERRQIPILGQFVIALLAVAIVQAFLVKPFAVPSESMEQTLLVGDRIAALRFDTTPSRQDVVVFGHGQTWSSAHLPKDPNTFKSIVRKFGDLTGIGPSNTQYTVKRVIGLPGDKVKCCDKEGHVTVNDTPLDEPYIYEDLPFEPGTMDCTSTTSSRRCFPEITVPADSYLVMGDHRSNSSDSVIGCRGSTDASGCAQFVADDRITGRVISKIWPPSRFGGV